MSHVPLISDDLRSIMLGLGKRSADGEAHDPFPTVRLHVPGTGTFWLLTELDPDDPDLAWGLCDLGLGAPALDHVRMSDLAALPGQPVVCDASFVAHQSLNAYLREAQDRSAVDDRSTALRLGVFPPLRIS